MKMQISVFPEEQVERRTKSVIDPDQLAEIYFSMKHPSLSNLSKLMAKHGIVSTRGKPYSYESIRQILLRSTLYTTERINHSYRDKRKEDARKQLQELRENSEELFR